MLRFRSDGATEYLFPEYREVSRFWEQKINRLFTFDMPCFLSEMYPFPINFGAPDGCVDLYDSYPIECEEKDFWYDN